MKLVRAFSIIGVHWLGGQSDFVPSAVGAIYPRYLFVCSGREKRKLYLLHGKICFDQVSLKIDLGRKGVVATRDGLDDIGDHLENFVTMTKPEPSNE